MKVKIGTKVGPVTATNTPTKRVTAPKQKGIISQMLEIICNDIQKKKREITGEDIMESNETWDDWEGEL